MSHHKTAAADLGDDGMVVDYSTDEASVAGGVAAAAPAGPVANASGNEAYWAQDLHDVSGFEQGVLNLRSKISVLPDSTPCPTAVSFQIEFEDHTLGNALRWIIMKNPQVELCGYTIPHPAEEKMNFRIQTYDTTTAREALEKGLNDLSDLCDVVIDKFAQSRNAHGGHDPEPVRS